MVWPSPFIFAIPILAWDVFFVDFDLFVERNKAIGTGGMIVVLKTWIF